MTGDPDGLLGSVRTRRKRHEIGRRDGEPSFARHLAQVGVLGWSIVVPTLVGIFAGRWIDRHFGTGVFWTAPLMILGLALGCWSGWRWTQGR